MYLLIIIIAVAWIVLSGFFLVSVCMMSSVANQTELLTEAQLPRRSLPIENGSPDEVAAQPSAEAPTW